MSNLAIKPKTPPIYSKDNHLPTSLVEAVWTKILVDNEISDSLHLHFIDKDPNLAPLQLDNKDLLNYIEKLHQIQDPNFTLSVPSDKYVISNIYLSNTFNPLLESLMILNVALALGCEKENITVEKAHTFLKTQKNPLFDRKGKEQLTHIANSNSIISPKLVSDFVCNSQDTIVNASMFVFEFVTKGEAYLFCEVYSHDCNPTKHTFHCDSNEVEGECFTPFMVFDPNNGYPHY